MQERHNKQKIRLETKYFLLNSPTPPSCRHQTGTFVLFQIMISTAIRHQISSIKQLSGNYQKKSLLLLTKRGILERPFRRDPRVRSSLYPPSLKRKKKPLRDKIGTPWRRRKERPYRRGKKGENVCARRESLSPAFSLFSSGHTQQPKASVLLRFLSEH